VPVSASKVGSLVMIVLPSWRSSSFEHRTVAPRLSRTLAIVR
jgi:hypothetical protein